MFIPDPAPYLPIPLLYFVILLLLPSVYRHLLVVIVEVVWIPALEGWG